MCVCVCIQLTYLVVKESQFNFAPLNNIYKGSYSQLRIFCSFPLSKIGENKTKKKKNIREKFGFVFV